MISLIHIDAVLSLLGIFYVIWEYVQGYRSVNWPSAKGVIVQSELRLAPGKRKEKMPYIYYRYVVNGKTHYSRRIAMHVANLRSHGDAIQLRGEYPANKEVVVRYHPIFNGFAVLQTGQRQTLLRAFLLLVLLIIFLVSLAAIFEPGFNPIFGAAQWAAE